jgi:subtilisin family serine protease
MEVDDAGTPAANPCRGTWTLRVHGDSVLVSGHYDAWIFFSSFGASALEGLWTAPDNTGNISVPGTAFNTTTVGGYISKLNWPSIDGGTYHFTASGPVGSLAWFSSSGPTRDGRLKPELSAPASAVTSSLSTDVVRDANSNPYIDPDNQHQTLPGTSFSSPHVAGAFAQLLSLNPTLDAIQLRSLVTATARVDANVTPVPNNDWGYGKLDVKAAADLMLKAVPDLTASANNQTFHWTAIATATTYNVYRGSLSLISPTYYGSCLATGLVAPTFNDASIPVPGGGFFYLVTGVKDGMEGMLGFRSDGTLRPNLSPCP